MLINDCTPAKPCSSKTLTNGKKYFFKFNDQYFLKLYLDEKRENIFILCYDAIELENKRYEIKLNKMDFNYSNRFFKMYDKIEEIYELTYEIFEFNRYKIIKPKDDSLLIELNYNLIVDNNNKFRDNIQLEMKLNTNGEFSRDYNYILINLKNKYNKDISKKKKELFD